MVNVRKLYRVCKKKKIYRFCGFLEDCVLFVGDGVCFLFCRYLVFDFVYGFFK